MPGARRRLLVVLCLIFPVFSSGQQNQRLRDRDPDLDSAKAVLAELQQARFRYGSFYLFSRLRLSDVGYSTGLNVPTGDSLGTLALSVEAPQRLYYVPHKKAIFTAEVIPAYNFFSGGDQDGQFDYATRADAHFLFNHLYLNAYTQLSNQLRAHVSDVNRLATSKVQETGVAGELKYSSRTSTLFTVRRSDIEYPDDRIQPDGVPMRLLDRTDLSSRVSIVHKTFPLTSLLVSSEVSDHDFDRASYKNSRRTWYGVGAIYNSGRTQVRVEAGPLKLAFDDPAEEDFSGFGANASARRINGRWTYSIGAERDLGFSILAGNNFYVSTSASGGVDYEATQRLSLHAGSAWQRDNFEQPHFGQLRRDTLSFNSVGFTYALRRLRTGIDAGWFARESTLLAEQQSGIRWVLRLSFTP